MNQLFDGGEKLHTESGGVCTVETFLGGGSQGEVYKADLNGRDVAVKWYFSHYLSIDSTLRERLANAIAKGRPSHRFLWPEELLTSARGLEGFGYMMPLREDRFYSIADLMTRSVEPSFRSMARAGFELAESFLNLHLQGLCYRDISFGNVFFDPQTGEVLICDNDNVDVNGREGSILGTPRFIAPEVVRGEATPSAQTDLYSLATLLFYLLMIHHPLDGAREVQIHAMDIAAMNRLYGFEPVFIFDPQDDSNRPVKDIHDNALIFWEIYPKFIRECFTRAFTDGIRDPQQGRVLESEWRGAMIRLHDSIVRCGRCDSEVFYDVDALKVGTPLKPCWKCGDVPQPSWRVRLNNPALNTFVGSQVVILNKDTKLYPHHVDEQRTWDFSEAVAEVSQHPAKPDLFGLKNLSDRSWYGQVGGGRLKEVPPGRSFSLKNDAKINFGKVEGAVRC